MRLGFTGTRDGMTPSQRLRVAGVIEIVRPDYAHHGCAKGSDREFHRMVANHSNLLIARRIEAAVRVLHPFTPEQATWAQENITERDVLMALDKDPIRRNHRIVDQTDITIATPSGTVEVHRGSGTWATIRYVRKQVKPLVICWPDGTITKERTLLI